MRFPLGFMAFWGFPMGFSAFCGFPMAFWDDSWLFCGFLWDSLLSGVSYGIHGFLAGVFLLWEFMAFCSFPMGFSLLMGNSGKAGDVHVTGSFSAHAVAN